MRSPQEDRARQAMAKQPFSVHVPLQDRTCQDHSLLGHSAGASRRGTTSDQLARAGFFRGGRCQCHSASARDFGGDPAGDGHPLCGLSFEQWACQCFTKTPSPSEQPSNTDDNNITIAFNCFHISPIVSVDNTLWGLLRLPKTPVQSQPVSDIILWYPVEASVQAPAQHPEWQQQWDAGAKAFWWE